MMMIRIMLMMILALTLSCASTSVVMINSAQTYPPTENVSILFKIPERDHKIIAIVEGNGSIFNNYSQVLQKIQKKAQKIGADAIIPLAPETVYVHSANVTNFDGSPLTIPGGTKMTIKAVAIRYWRVLDLGGQRGNPE